MEKTKQNGQAVQGTAKPASDSTKGVAAMAIATVKKVNPYSEKVGKIGEAQKKVLQLQRLREVESDLNNFKVGNEDNVHEYVILKDGNGTKFETSNSYLAAKVVDCLRVELSNRIPELETEIMNATI